MVQSEEYQTYEAGRRYAVTLGKLLTHVWAYANIPPTKRYNLVLT